jgi:hypothetical protein
LFYLAIAFRTDKAIDERRATVHQKNGIADPFG